MLKKSENTIRLIFLVLLLAIIPEGLFAQLSPAGLPEKLLCQSIKEVLGSPQSITWHKITLSADLKSGLVPEMKIKKMLPDTLFIGKTITASDTIYIIYDQAPSRSELFDYLLFFKSNGEILDYDVITYREMYGQEIDYPLFRKQFRGKNAPEKIIFGRTIQNITGATISARSITMAIRDWLILWKAIKPLLQKPLIHLAHHHSCK